MQSPSKQRSQHNALVAASIERLPEQIIWICDNWPKKMVLSRKGYEGIVVCGMGGSTLAADLLRYIYWQELALPIFIINNYQLPKFVTNKHLVVIASYSGLTEEALSCFQEAKKRRLPLFVLTTGGKLGELAVSRKIPHFIFDPKFNPSGQPRLGLGYFIAACGLLMHLAGGLNLTSTELRTVAKKMKSNRQIINRQAKLLVKQNCLVVASEHLLGSAHILSNQLNETADLFAAYFALPEMNHHLLEGLSGLGGRGKVWTAILLTSGDYHQRTRRRYAVTEQILRKMGLRVIRQSFGGTKLEQGIKALWWSSALTLAVARKEGLDAGAIPLVESLKRSLGDK